jgi:hypothetical protein
MILNHTGDSAYQPMTRINLGLTKGPLLAVDCHLPGLGERLLTGKPFLNFCIQDISILLLYSALTRQVEAHMQNSGLTVTLL